MVLVNFKDDVVQQVPSTLQQIPIFDLLREYSTIFEFLHEGSEKNRTSYENSEKTWMESSKTLQQVPFISQRTPIAIENPPAYDQLQKQ
jgi:hypothetical protein